MIAEYFEFNRLKTDLKTEVIAGLTTFATMAYIIVVNPKILEAAGIPFGPSMVATIMSAFFGTLAMGVYAKRPFAIAPYMGENAFIAYTVVKVLGYSWQTALGAIFIGGVLFTAITLLRIRSWLADSIPNGLKIGFAVGIGLFLAFIGLNETGIVTIGASWCTSQGRKPKEWSCNPLNIRFYPHLPAYDKEDKGCNTYWYCINCHTWLLPSGCTIPKPDCKQST